MDITVDDFVSFARRTIKEYLSAVDRVGDDLVNVAPALTGANTPYQLATHAFAACTWWCDHIICGHPSDRTRAEEFTASGSVADLHDAAAALVSLLDKRRDELDAATSLAFEAETGNPLDGEWTVGAAMIHAYEELAQHLGHLEITVDLLLAN